MYIYIYIDFDNIIKINFFISPPNASIPVFLHIFNNIRNIPMANKCTTTNYTFLNKFLRSSYNI